MPPFRLIFTCEHGGNDIPPEYLDCFDGGQAILSSHRGYDPGTLELASRFAETFSAPLHYSTTTRLLVELNRSVRNRRVLFSSFTKRLSPEMKEAILRDFYFPYRKRVEDAIAGWVGSGGTVLHLSVHSFTPVLDGRARNADIGLLYDPGRGPEKEFSLRYGEEIIRLDRTVRVRRNYPYRGIADGFTTYLRSRFPGGSYLGIELEVNQKFPLGHEADWQNIQSLLTKALANSIS